MLKCVGVRLAPRAVPAALWDPDVLEPCAPVPIERVFTVDLTLNYGPLRKRTVELPPGLDPIAFGVVAIPESLYHADSPEGRWLRGQYFEMQDENKRRGVASGFFASDRYVH